MSGSRAAIAFPGAGVLLLASAAPIVPRCHDVEERADGAVTDAAIPGSYPRYIYPKRDVVWIVEADKPVLTEIIAALP